MMERLENNLGLCDDIKELYSYRALNLTPAEISDKLARLEAERDAAVEDVKQLLTITSAFHCSYCKSKKTNGDCENKYICVKPKSSVDVPSMWQWHGLEKTPTQRPTDRLEITPDTDMTQQPGCSMIYKQIAEMLPCKVGDTIYRINTYPDEMDKYIERFTVYSIDICADETINIRDDPYDGVICTADNLINGTPYLDCYLCFLDENAAESVLKEMEGKHESSTSD